MNHKLALPVHKVAAVTARPPAAGNDRNPSFRAFADILREAEAVRDRVELQRPAGAPGRGGFLGALQGAMAWMPGMGAVRGGGAGERPRRAPGERDDADGA